MAFTLLDQIFDGKTVKSAVTQYPSHAAVCVVVLSVLWFSWRSEVTTANTASILYEEYDLVPGYAL